MNKTKAQKGGRKIFGHSMTSVIRTMGKTGFTFKQAKSVLRRKRVKPSDATIRIMLSAGKLGNRGPVAELAKGQLSELKSLAAA